MRRVVLFSLLLVAALLALDERLQKADHYYQNRHKDYKGYTDKTYNLCNEILTEDANDAQALWRMARLYCLYGDDKDSKQDKLDRYNTARDYAQKAKAAGADIAEAHFWYGVALGRIGQTKGVLNSLNLAGPVKDAFQKALSLNPKFAPAMDGLAVWYMEVPGVAGGDLAKSIEYLKKGIATDPNYTLLYIDLAKVYIKQKDYSAARTQLQKCLAITNPTNPADFILDDKPDAQELLAEIEGK
jgi:tetratricopeptide (TPR) repeat protein